MVEDQLKPLLNFNRKLMPVSVLLMDLKFVKVHWLVSLPGEWAFISEFRINLCRCSSELDLCFLNTEVLVNLRLSKSIDRSCSYVIVDAISNSEC